MDKKTTEFYERLRLELNNNTSWPSKYLFKFIVPNEQFKIDKVENTFNNILRRSKTRSAGTYTAVVVAVIAVASGAVGSATWPGTIDTDSAASSRGSCTVVVTNGKLVLGDSGSSTTGIDNTGTAWASDAVCTGISDGDSDTTSSRGFVTVMVTTCKLALVALPLSMPVAVVSMDNDRSTEKQLYSIEKKLLY